MIGFSPHYLEAVPGILAAMGNADTIALEEPWTPGFSEMLNGSLPVSEYLLQMDTDFPQFAAALCEGLQTLHAQGKQILQLDPYLNRLVTIHECFADNQTPEEVIARSDLRCVYLAEKAATGALIHFYQLSTGHDFQAIVDSVKHFAKLDADRIRLRDELRAEAIASLVSPGRSIYVEAGYMHFGILKLLRSRFPALPPRHPAPALKIRTAFILQEASSQLQAKHRNMGPGDLLTLHFVFHPDTDQDSADLLAARSLIAIRLVAKEELVPGQSTFPQSEDDARVNALVQRLDFEQCRVLYERIHRAPRATTLRYARQMALGQHSSRIGRSSTVPDSQFITQRPLGENREHA